MYKLESRKMLKTFIIAEIGINHNGDLLNACELIKKAKRAGADAVKFQAAVPCLVSSRFAKKAGYQKIHTTENESQLEMIKKLHLPLQAYPKLQRECKKQKILFLCSAFDMKSLKFLSTINLPIYKIPSGEITNLPYIRFIGSLKKSVILSSGMANLGEIENAILNLEQAGTGRKYITVLHCNSEYPTPISDVNLRAMITIRKALGVKVGYSDHTLGIEVPTAAVALGATIIEKHLTISRNLSGPDHKSSLIPEEFAIIT